MVQRTAQRTVLQMELQIARRMVLQSGSLEQRAGLRTGRKVGRKEGRMVQQTAQRTVRQMELQIARRRALPMAQLKGWHKASRTALQTAQKMA